MRRAPPPPELPSDRDPPSAWPEDLAWRDRVLAGDEDAAEALVARHIDGLFEFVLYRVGRDEATADDVVQDTFVVAIERLAEYDGRSSLHGWLCGIARNKVRSRRRKRRPRPLAEVLRDADEEIDAILERVAEEPLPDEVLEREETRELVGATLASLPPQYRDALVDRYVEGRSVPESARRQGRHVKAAESTLHRARKAFAQVFALIARKRREGSS